MKDHTEIQCSKSVLRIMAKNWQSSLKLVGPYIYHLFLNERGYWRVLYKSVGDSELTSSQK